ncbi:hypothetical protein O3W44_21665 [Pantoea sp. LMR881]|nr:hypothetical protein [Pantoea sp. LMR881]
MRTEQIADSVAAAVTHPVTVQVINQGAGIWGNVATGLITAGAAIAAVMLTHRFTLKREKAAAEGKQIRERYFIGTELVFMLERFSQRCAPAAYESGYYDHESGYIQVTHDLPDIDYSSITGDWRSLPQDLMYRLIQIPVLQEEARKSVAAAFNNDSPGMVMTVCMNLINSPAGLGFVQYVFRGNSDVFAQCRKMNCQCTLVSMADAVHRASPDYRHRFAPRTQPLQNDVRTQHTRRSKQLAGI